MDKVVHFEIPAGDLEKAKKFYSEVFGWQIMPYNDWYLSVVAAESDGNKMSKEKGAINGGIQKRGPRAKMPTIIIQVKNIDDSSAKIKKNGGKIAVEKEKISDMGFYAQFDDTEGNRIGLFQMGI